MDSNTPNSGQSPHSNTELIPNISSLTPSDTRVVSQSQDSARLFQNQDSTPDHQHLLDALCPAHNVDNTPRIGTPKAPLAPTPVISSPDRTILQHNVAAQLFTSNPKMKRKQEGGRKSGAMKAMKKRAFADPTKSLLWFLREKYVKAHASVLTAKGLSTAQKYKAAYENWSAKTKAERAKNAFAPFEDMKEQFHNGWPLAKQYRHLLIEDFMLLEEGAEVVCFMSKAHPFMKSASWKTNLREAMEIKPYEHLKMKSTVFFGFDLKVSRNIYRSDILQGVCSKSDLVYKCTKHGGNGLTMSLSNHYQKLFTYHTFMEHNASLLIYSRNLSSRIPQIRKVIFNVKDTTRIAPTASRFLDELFGDSEQYISVLHHHDSKYKSNVRAAADKALKEADLSTERVIQAFTLSNTDPSFVKVRDEIDKAMATSVVQIYGEFSKLTTPILTQVSSIPLRSPLPIHIT